MAHVIARTSTPPETQLQSVRVSLATVDLAVAIDVQTMSGALAFAFLPSRIGATLLGFLRGTWPGPRAGRPLCGGDVCRQPSNGRDRQSRRALGASGGAVIGRALRDWAWLVATGLALGLAGAWFVTRPLSEFLVGGLSTTDPAIFVGTPLLLAALSAVATIVPALAALRVDPARVLRNE